MFAIWFQPKYAQKKVKEEKHVKQRRNLKNNLPCELNELEICADILSTAIIYSGVMQAGDCMIMRDNPNECHYSSSLTITDLMKRKYRKL